MKLTVDEWTPSYWRLHYRNQRVFLDGAEMKRVREVDTDEGYVDIYAEGEDGRLVLDGECAKIERRHGVVKVIEGD
ncbi:hypothetical protein WMC41_15955 [Shinella yambaruensis]|uniref:hypothetical protein n=1 Tax=Shinella yambaruensis TaxID=415996 RepID=UPI003D795EEA